MTEREAIVEGRKTTEALILGLFICIGLAVLGYSLAASIRHVKSLDRTVTVKGLSEREVEADIAIWPIKFDEASNDLEALSSAIQSKNRAIVRFLEQAGFDESEISYSAPAIVDKQAQGYSPVEAKFRYSASSTISVYTTSVELVKNTRMRLVELAQQGIAISGQDYQTRTEFIFTGLNDIKPDMVEEATKNAREVAEKFATDSNSRLGKIKKARQGQFSIVDRDSNTPHIKKVRVVSTIEYYLSD
jgi:hypothetical protein